MVAKILHRRDVAESLRHLGSVSEEKLTVDPEAGKRFFRRALGLRDLILVVWEDQVDATAMDIERLTQIFHRHCRALEMPAGSPASPRRIPRGAGCFVFGSRRFPEREILGVLLRVVVPHDA